jgi:very-short-patch-repair endonuclease
VRAREFRKNMTEAEQALWFRLRRKQLLDVQFYRQRPIGNHVVDFYAPSAKLVIEVDGSQHLEKDHLAQRHRTARLRHGVC